jgi:hypothetical protein
VPRLVKLYKLPNKPTIEGLRPMKKKDIIPMTKLLKEYLKYIPHLHPLTFIGAIDIKYVLIKKKCSTGSSPEIRLSIHMLLRIRKPMR